jgi:hypothetical protein
MGRSYWFECSKCGYRVAVSGRADRGRDFFVQTIQCRDCKRLYDAVTRFRFPDPQTLFGSSVSGISLQRNTAMRRWLAEPPSFERALNRLPYAGIRRFRWLEFKPRCPVSAIHRVQTWEEPGKCPRCEVYLEKNALPYRIWE